MKLIKLTTQRIDDMSVGESIIVDMSAQTAMTSITHSTGADLKGQVVYAVMPKTETVVKGLLVTKMSDCVERRKYKPRG